MDGPGAAADGELVGGQQRAGQPRLGVGRGGGPARPLWPERRQRRGQRAAGAVGVSGVDPGAGQQRAGAVGVDQGVGGLRRAGQVPALDQHPGTGAGGQPVALGDRRLQVRGGRLTHQHRELGQVRGDDVGQRQQPGDGQFGVRIQQPVTAGGNHHRVEDHVLRTMLGQPPRHHGHVGRVAEHPDLDRVDHDVVADRGELLGQELRRGTEHAAHATGVLGGQRGDRGHAVRAVRGERLEVRLDAGPAGRVGAGDGQGADDHRSSVSHGTGCRRCLTCCRDGR